MRSAVFFLALLALAVPAAQAQQPPAAATAAVTPDFEFYRQQIEPILLKKRPGHARCYACHAQGTTMTIQKMSPGATTWNEEQSRKNFELIVRRAVVPGQPMKSRLLLMPLAHEAGGIEFHPGGKHFKTVDDPEAKVLIAFINGAKVGS